MTDEISDITNNHDLSAFSNTPFHILDIIKLVY